MTSSGKAAAGDLLLHPVALAALALLVLNDHFLKAVWPGPLTGKLSDLAGMIFLPVFLVSAWELVLAVGRRWRAPSMSALVVASVVSAASLALVKTTPLAAQVAGYAFGTAQWMIATPIRLLVGEHSPAFTTTSIVVDPTDLLALPAVGLAVWAGGRRVLRRGACRHGARPVAAS
jgi:hypothetical protein